MKMTFFTLYARDMDIIDDLDDDAAGRLLKALYHHANGDEVYVNGDERMAYKFITKAIDEHASKYADTCEKNRSNINARWEKYRQGVQPNTTVYERIQSNDLVLKEK